MGTTTSLIFFQSVLISFLTFVFSVALPFLFLFLWYSLHFLAAVFLLFLFFSGQVRVSFVFLPFGFVHITPRYLEEDILGMQLQDMRRIGLVTWKGN